MARKNSKARGVAVPPSTGLREFRRRESLSKTSSPWIVVVLWAVAFTLLLVLVAVAKRWNDRAGVDAIVDAPPRAPSGSVAAPVAPVAAVTPAPALPVIRLSHGAESANADAGAAPSVPRLIPQPGAADNPYIAAATATPETELDRLVSYQLTRLQIDPAPICSDAIFLRRAYLDVIGALPASTEVRDFLDDTSPDKRQRLIDDLLDRPEFADYWAMRWCDILRVKAEFPINLWPNAAQAYHRWIRTALRDDLPYDRFVRELLTASGSNFRTPQVNFYRAMQSRDPESIAKTVALTFMGERADKWPKEELQNLSVFFSQIGYKPTGEWKEQIVLFDPRAVKRPPDGSPLQGMLPDGTTVELPLGADPRMIFADWLIDGDNPRFVRPIVNRVWNWLLGRAIVEPVDDFRPDNPPRNVDLLDYLGREFVASGYDLKHLCRLILNSSTYQRACVPTNTGVSESAAEFASYPLRRLDA
ncbi:MAG: DUF1553 domain-containing protein, partial [Planctomycetaceae bacterium]|nr:DUF1553 domain-containing protein [Planctomycetaceae bacterium]